eukprot:jgi/Botrbrau1/6861/Bobra.152_2s0020.1
MLILPLRFESEAPSSTTIAAAATAQGAQSSLGPPQGSMQGAPSSQAHAPGGQETIPTQAFFDVIPQDPRGGKRKSLEAALPLAKRKPEDAALQVAKRLRSSSEAEAAPSCREEEAGGGGLLAGMELLFWASAHMKTLKERCRAAGARIRSETRIGPLTTHVVAARTMPLSSVAAHLQDSDLGRPYREVEAGNMRLRIPEGLSLVTPDFLSDSLAAGRILPVSLYLLPFQAGAVQPAASSPSHDAEGETPLASPNPGAHPSGGGSCISPAGAPPPANASASGTSQVATFMGLRSSVFGGLAVGETKPERTGGDSGMPWGSAGVWLEPYSEQEARRTINIIDRHWHRQDRRSSSEEEELTVGAEGPVSTADSVEAAPQNGVCDHMACSAKPFCLVAELERSKANYSERGPDQFKIKAVEKGIRALLHHKKPLREAGDVDSLRTADGGTVGQGTRDKVKEILARGYLPRNKELENSLQHQCVQLFLKVWGAGDVTANKWYREGCRSLEDVRLRSDLSEQQLVGLKYFDDFQLRIPASVVAQVEEVVQNAVLDVLKCREAEDASKFFAFAVGSYCRGKPATGDIDFLIIPPASVGDANFMAPLLRYLLKVGLLVDEMGASHISPRLHGKGSSSWMGVAKPAGLSHHIRIDIKIYPHQYLTFAVNYFIGSGPFVRALRYWARSSETCAALARQINPRANGFKLSDTTLIPILKEGPNHQGKARESHKAEEQELGPPVACEDETALFQALKLHYVPPKMRFFGPNFQ